MGPSTGEPRRAAGGSMTAAYVRVLGLWLGVLAALWWLQRAFL
jgi:hypothetical protein